MAESPNTLLENIKNWMREKNEFQISQLSNPKAHFSIQISPYKQNVVPPITIAFPKGTDSLIFGWNWLLEVMDTKAYSSITDNRRKENIIMTLQNESRKRNLILQGSPDMYNLAQLAVHRLIPSIELTKDKFRNIVMDLIYLWALAMLQFEKQGMNKAGFNPSDYV
ncbi:MAG: DUF2299 family protein [Candidatus Nitrosocosmicus sp.]